MEHIEDLNDHEIERPVDRLDLPAGQWLTSDGRQVAIDAMASKHLENTIKKLHREGVGGSSKCREMIGELDRRHGVDALPAGETQVALPSRSTPKLPRSGDVPDDRVGFVRLILAIAFSDERVSKAIDVAREEARRDQLFSEQSTALTVLGERLIEDLLSVLYPGKTSEAFEAVARRELDVASLGDAMHAWDGKPARVAAFLRDRLEQEIAQSLEVLTVPTLPEPAGVSF